MCFSEKQSYINFVLLVICGLYKIKEWRLGVPLLFLSLKDLLQGFLYKNIGNPKLLNFYTILSWVHICFQPLFVNIIGSYFDINFENKREKFQNKENKNENDKIDKQKDKKVKFWYFVYFINLIYGILSLFSLKDINKIEKNCVGSPLNNYCKKETKSYIGKIHIGYQFNLNNTKFLMEYFYPLLFILPGILTKAYIPYLSWLSFILIIYIVSKLKNLRNGEFSAIWCFSSILYGIPIALFSKQFLNLFRNIDKNLINLYKLI